MSFVLGGVAAVLMQLSDPKALWPGKIDRQDEKKGPKGPYAILSVIATPPTTNDTIKRHDKKKVDIKTNTDSTTFTDSG